MRQLNNERILLYGEDANDEAKAILEGDGLEVVCCSDLSQVLAQIELRPAVFVISRENVSSADYQTISETIKKQPHWLHLPVLVIHSDSEAYQSIANVTVLERPIRARTLTSSVRAALNYSRRESEVRDLMEQLDYSRQQAVDANRAKSDFLANISHEIRTPLGAVLGFGELVMDSAVSEREKQIYMVAVRRNGQLLSALIDDILDLSKVEAGRIETEKIEFSLNELLSEIVSAVEPKVSKKGLVFNLEKDPELNAIVSDPIRVKQILMNLVGNAAKFTSHGQIDLRVKVERIEGKSNQRRLIFEIEDSGIGIAAGQTGLLFKPFVQADTSTTRRYGGTGLGLVLSQRLARLMGGDVRLKWSVPGGGSCFEASLMVNMPTTAVVEKTVRNEGRVSALPLKNSKILVVDDSLDNQMLISRILKLLGAEVDLANDGIEAIDRAMSQVYDVILMDLQMPRLGGVEATRILRSKGYSRPIVALTAHSLKEDRARCLSVGCTDYLTKPIQRTLLVQVLERVAGKSQVVN